MLSFISMHRVNWRDHSYAACCGVSDQVMWQMMKDNPHIEKIYLCLDNDVPGQEAAERLSQKLTIHGVSHEILIPVRKDWNEVVCEDFIAKIHVYPTDFLLNLRSCFKFIPRQGLNMAGTYLLAMIILFLNKFKTASY